MRVGVSLAAPGPARQLLQASLTHEQVHPAQAQANLEQHDGQHARQHACGVGCGVRRSAVWWRRQDVGAAWSGREGGQQRTTMVPGRRCRHTGSCCATRTARLLPGALAPLPQTWLTVCEHHHAADKDDLAATGLLVDVGPVHVVADEGGHGNLLGRPRRPAGTAGSTERARRGGGRGVSAASPAEYMAAASGRPAQGAGSGTCRARACRRQHTALT